MSEGKVRPHGSAAKHPKPPGNGGWEAKKLVEVATLQRGFDLPAQARVSGTVPLVSSSGPSDTHNAVAVRGPGVVTGRSGSVGNVFFVEQDFWPLNTVLYVKDFHGNNPRFVFYLLTKFDLKRFASGAGVPTLNRNFVHDELVRVPPLPEQRRIVGILDEAFAGIATAKAHAEKNLQNARELFESHLQAVFTQEGDGWVEAPLRECVQEISTGPFGSLLHKSDYEHGGIPLVNPMNIEGDKIIPDSRKAVGKATAKRLARYVLREDDIVIGRRGEIGRCAVVSRAQAGWLCGTGSFFVRPSAKTDPYFLSHLLRSRPYRRRLEGVAERATMPSISNDDLANLAIRLPPLTQQRQTVSLIESVSAETERLESLYRRKLAALDELKKSLLHQAFSGQL